MDMHDNLLAKCREEETNTGSERGMLHDETETKVHARIITFE